MNTRATLLGITSALFVAFGIGVTLLPQTKAFPVDSVESFSECVVSGGFVEERPTRTCTHDEHTYTEEMRAGENTLPKERETVPGDDTVAPHPIDTSAASATGTLIINEESGGAVAQP